MNNYIYICAFLLFSIGIYILIAEQHRIKRLFGMSIFQTSVLLFYISLGHVKNASIPILNAKSILYSNPLPHVLMLTAIVVGVATLAVGLAIVVQIKCEHENNNRSNDDPIVS